MVGKCDPVTASDFRDLVLTVAIECIPVDVLSPSLVQLSSATLPLCHNSNEPPMASVSEIAS